MNLPKLPKLPQIKAPAAGKARKAGYTKTADPLKDVKYTDTDFAEDCARELTAMQKAYRERAKKEDARFKNATDSEFWIAVCFHSREEKEAFLKDIDLDTRRYGDKYITGENFRRCLNLPERE